MKLVYILYLILRYFRAHNKNIFVISGKRKEKEILLNIANSLEEYGAQVRIARLGGTIFDKLRLIYQFSGAKVVVISSKKYRTLKLPLESSLEFLLYNNKNNHLNFYRTRGIFPVCYVNDLNPGIEYQKEILFLYNFSRVGYYECWINRFLNAVIKGDLVGFLYPQIFIAIIDFSIKFINQTTRGIIKSLVENSIFLIKKIFPLKKIIIFRACHHQYTSNPKYICEAIHADKRFSNYGIVWLVDKGPQTQINAFPSWIRLIDGRSFHGKWLLATAEAVVYDSVFNDIRLLSKKQLIVQTWHGSFGIKRIGDSFDRKVGKLNNKRTTVCISNSLYEDWVYRNTFWPDTPIVSFGHARSVCLLKCDEKKKQLIKIKLGIPQSAKIILYAPTFREEYKALEPTIPISELSAYNIDRRKVLTALTSKFGGNWYWLDRFHFFLKRFKNFKKATTNIPNYKNVSDYPDVQDLLLISDIVISDYSSITFDFVLTKRPAFIYASDLSKYSDQDRGFYYPISETPFPLARSNCELIYNIMSFDMNKYRNSVEEFLKNKGSCENLQAIEKTINFILENLRRKDELH